MQQRVNGVVQVRPEIARIEDYVPGESLAAFSARTGVPVGQLIKLNSNESPYPPSPRVVEALGAAGLLAGDDGWPVYRLVRSTARRSFPPSRCLVTVELWKRGAGRTPVKRGIP